MHTGLFASWQKTVSQMPSWPGMLLMLAAAGGYFFLVHTRVRPGLLYGGLQACGAGTAVTGILLWTGLPGHTGFQFLMLMLHGIFAAAMAGLLVFLSLGKTIAHRIGVFR